MVSFAPPETFKRRAEFLGMAARGRKIARPGFVLQGLRGNEGDKLRVGLRLGLRVGYTATKKTGNAVARNRARRRLKEAARLVFPELPLAGMRLVLICRKETATMNFNALCDGLRAALAEVAK